MGRLDRRGRHDVDEAFLKLTAAEFFENESRILR